MFYLQSKFSNFTLVCTRAAGNYSGVIGDLRNKGLKLCLPFPLEDVAVFRGISRKCFKVTLLIL